MTGRPRRATSAIAALSLALLGGEAPLPPLDLADLRPWNWQGRWAASQWPNPNGPLPWRYDHVARVPGGDTLFRLDRDGAPQLLAQGGTPASGRGWWEVDVTLPRMTEGVVVAPLWLYDPASREEIDFEFAGRRGLDVSLHAAARGAGAVDTTRLFAGRDFSGARLRLGIRLDEAAGYAALYVDGVPVRRWERGAMPAFVAHPLRPAIEMWAAGPAFASWAGRWPGPGASGPLIMTIHGYRYRALP